jgi:PhnB protein
MQITPYLFFDGTCAEAMAFYADVFGTSVAHTLTYGDMPDGSTLPEDMKSRIANTGFKVGDVMVMASDTMPDFGHEHRGHTGFDLTVTCDTADEAHALFARLSEGGEVIMAIDAVSWAEAFGTCRDRFGVPWMIVTAD